MNGSDKQLTPVEQHLGDRLAALVDGELGHDARERVLSHLATCWSCKAEADAQRQLKTVFADTAPPPPSDGLLARLQGLPATGDSGPGSHGPGPGPSGPGLGGPPLRDIGPDGRSPLSLDYFPAGRGSFLSPERGFRVHRPQSARDEEGDARDAREERARRDLERAASRGRRFAFAAAGAFSLAALALGGAVGAGSAGGSPAAAGEGGSSAGPARSAAAAAAADRDSRRRTAPTSKASARSTRSGSSVGATSASSRTFPLFAGASAVAPSLIRPPALPRLVAEKGMPLGAVPGRTSAPVTAAPAVTPGP